MSVKLAPDYYELYRCTDDHTSLRSVWGAVAHGCITGFQVIAVCGLTERPSRACVFHRVEIHLDWRTTSARRPLRSGARTPALTRRCGRSQPALFAWWRHQRAGTPGWGRDVKAQHSATLARRRAASSDQPSPGRSRRESGRAEDIPFGRVPCQERHLHAARMKHKPERATRFWNFIRFSPSR